MNLLIRDTRNVNLGKLPEVIITEVNKPTSSKYISKETYGQSRVGGLIPVSVIYNELEQYTDSTTAPIILIEDIFSNIKFTDKGGKRFMDFLGYIQDGYYGNAQFIITGLGYDYLDINEDKSIGRYTQVEYLRKLNNTLSEVFNIDDYNVLMTRTSKDMYHYMTLVRKCRAIDTVRCQMMNNGIEFSKSVLEDNTIIPDIIYAAEELHINPEIIAQCVFNSLYNTEEVKLDYSINTLYYAEAVLNNSIDKSKLEEVLSTLTYEEAKKVAVLCTKSEFSLDEVEYLVNLQLFTESGLVGIINNYSDEIELFMNSIEKFSSKSLKNSNIQTKTTKELSKKYRMRGTTKIDISLGIKNYGLKRLKMPYVFHESQFPDFYDYQFYKIPFTGVIATIKQFMINPYEVMVEFIPYKKELEEQTKTTIIGGHYGECIIFSFNNNLYYIHKKDVTSKLLCDVLFGATSLVPSLSRFKKEKDNKDLFNLEKAATLDKFDGLIPYLRDSEDNQISEELVDHLKFIHNNRPKE